MENGFPDRSFDIEFWQEQGDEAIFAAAWEMELAEEVSHGRKPTLQRLEVEYLIVGGFAVMKYGEPCYTKDLDVWVHDGAKFSWLESLKKFGAPMALMGSRGHFHREAFDAPIKGWVIIP